MAREFGTQFNVRYDECGTGRQLRSSIYLGYTQEVATLDAMDAGWAGNPWVIRRTRLFIHQPICYPAVVQMNTRVKGFTRSQAQRQYVFYGVDGEIMAEAESLWVNLDRDTLRPARIPAEAVSVWFPDEPAPAPLAMPSWSPTPTAEPYRTATVVGYNLLDGLKHVNNARYLDLLDDAGWQALVDVGLSSEQVSSGGILAPALYDIEYFSAATFNERLTTATWLDNVTAEGFERVQEIHRDNQLIVRSQSSWRGWDVSGQPTLLAPAIVETLRAVAR